MIPRRPYRQRTRDILILALRSLAPAEEILCTSASYRNIRDRVEAFKATHPERVYRNIDWYNVTKIKRVA